VSAALGGILAVYKAVIIFTVGKPMSESYFNIRSGKMNNRLQALLAHIFIEQVDQTISGKKLIPVEIYYKSGIKINIVFKHGIHIL
jgi:hypothetical protein